MRIEVHRTTNFKDVPQTLWVTFDGPDDRYVAAFENSADSTLMRPEHGADATDASQDADQKMREHTDVGQSGSD